MSEQIKIKEEPTDTGYETMLKDVTVKSEPQDIPDNFFDDFENNQYLDELIDNVGDNLEAGTEEDEKGSDADDIHDIELSKCYQKIGELNEKIKRRKEKLLKSTVSMEASMTELRSKRRGDRDRVRSRSPIKKKARRSRSRERKRSRSGSNDRKPSHRSRMSRSRDRRRERSHSFEFERSYRNIGRRSRSRGRRSRSPIAGCYRRTRSRERSHSSRPKAKLSFLDELEEIFAKKGQSFPEKNHIKEILKNKSQIINDSRTPLNHSFTNQAMNFAPVSYSGAGETSQNFSFPQVKMEPMESSEMNQASSEPAANIKVENIKMTKEQQREEVSPYVASRFFEMNEGLIKMCTSSLEKLQKLEINPHKTSFIYTPTIITTSELSNTLEYRSPLNHIRNVQLSFNSTNRSINLKQWGMWKPTKVTSNVIREIGYNVPQLCDRLSLRDLKGALKNDIDMTEAKFGGKMYQSFFTDSATQTDEASCSSCIIRQLKRFADKNIEAKPLVAEMPIQTEREDELPIMNTIALLNSSQLLALNDFADVIKAPAPTNANEQYRLREKLIDIFNLSQRPCMMPTRISAPSTINYNSAIPNSSRPTFFETPNAPSMYPLQSNPIMNTQVPFMPTNNPLFSQQYPTYSPAAPVQPHPYFNHQPVPSPQNHIIRSSAPRREDPRNREESRIRELPASRKPDLPTPPRPSASGTKSFGRGAFNSSRR